MKLYNKRELQVWADGIYKGLSIANDTLKKEGTNFRIRTIPKRKIFKRLEKTYEKATRKTQNKP